MMADTLDYFMNDKVPRRGETGLTGGELWAQVYRCKDGEYFTIACLEKHLWHNFCDEIGRVDLKDKQFASGKEKDYIVAELAQIFLTKTRYEWFEFFKNKNVCCAPVNNLEEAFKDPHILHRQMILEFEHQNIGKVKQLGFPIKLFDTPASIRNLGCPLGTHTDEVLGELGYSRQEISNLRRDGVLG
jgi:crotonobetainyl-CoA:carnitine CoA-transferase CaiB-like acyl-CoA transferase